MRARLTAAYDLARTALRKKAIASKKYYDRNMRLITYKPGTRILMKDYTPRDKGDSKLCPKFCGPFWVIDKLGDVNYRVVEHEHAIPKIVHHNRMKPYTSREPCKVPDWVKRASKSLPDPSEDAEYDDQRGSQVYEMPAVKLRRQRRVARNMAKRATAKPRRGRPPKTSTNNTTTKVKPTINVPVNTPSDDEEEEVRVDAAPTRKSRAGREVRRPARYL